MIVKGKAGLLQDAAIIKNSDLMQLKSKAYPSDFDGQMNNMRIGGFREVTEVSSKKEESIYSLGAMGAQMSGQSEYAGLGLGKQQSAINQMNRGQMMVDSRGKL